MAPERRSSSRREALVERIAGAGEPGGGWGSSARTVVRPRSDAMVRRPPSCRSRSSIPRFPLPCWRGRTRCSSQGARDGYPVRGPPPRGGFRRVLPGYAEAVSLIHHLGDSPRYTFDLVHGPARRRELHDTERLFVQPADRYDDAIPGESERKEKCTQSGENGHSRRVADLLAAGVIATIDSRDQPRRRLSQATRIGVSSGGEETSPSGDAATVSRFRPSHGGAPVTISAVRPPG